MNDTDLRLLAAIEALRAYIAARGRRGRSVSALAEEWRGTQLFPPSAEEMRSVLARLHKSGQV